MELLDQHQALRKQILEYFGYIENWRVLPIDDSRGYYWHFTDDESSGCVRFSEIRERLEDEDAGQYYENEIYTQRHLQKWVYRGDDFTMICVDTHVDGNKFLQIFENSKEVSI